MQLKLLKKELFRLKHEGLESLRKMSATCI